jgi:ankyrin repeat protein
VCDLGYRGVTPLMIACIQDSSDCVQMLLDARADATLTDAQGLNALHYAAKHGAKLCVDKLLHTEMLPPRRLSPRALSL